MIIALQVEFAKLRRSLILLLIMVAPGMLIAFTLFNLMRQGTTWTGPQAIQGATALWAIFMLPMAATAIASQLAQIEHTNATWDYLLALPVKRTHLFLAKALTLLSIVLCMSSLLFGGLLLDVWLAPRLGADITALSLSEMLAQAALLAKVVGASLLLQMLQLWVALRFQSFVPALGMGICGTFLAVAASSAAVGVYLPWQMPINQLSVSTRADLALILGSIGGLIALLTMTLHLARRQAH
ncbi:ABC transporter permease [Pseudoxanthomonas sp. JBR18]|uniref:ABC transporter permease n=1 Tax=Pseudoxanthomonas sp. JBR18 TaxID=2969308 RepID=UPI0023054C9B|nr:ABC transporter permease [Pseudoxanthomonas sp. JBR18]WCE03621.1 ABC transporter permease [Pseudoxanthomonas sp. JBR18]